jgi:hypothetical protein
MIRNGNRTFGIVAVEQALCRRAFVHEPCGRPETHPD